MNLEPETCLIDTVKKFFEYLIGELGGKFVDEFVFQFVEDEVQLFFIEEFALAAGQVEVPIVPLVHAALHFGGSRSGNTAVCYFPFRIGVDDTVLDFSLEMARKTLLNIGCVPGVSTRRFCLLCFFAHPALIELEFDGLEDDHEVCIELITNVGGLGTGDEAVVVPQPAEFATHLDGIGLCDE